MFAKLTSLPPLVKAGIGVLAAVLLAVLVYFLLGPIWALGVLAAAVLVGLLMLLISLIAGMMRKRKASAFDRQLAGGQVSQAEVDRARTDLVNRWQEAMKVLRGSNLSVYDLPWFLLIGEPQSGKSTTLMNSGIEFPIGREAVSGVGGTRNCDWWFANDAVILDTAGRFTFQEANAPDKDEWLTFLQLLRSHRSACPLNGVLVVIPVTSLQEDAIEVLEEKANNIRTKLDNVQKILEVQFPVFILITKADHVLGFTEFCGRLTVDQQRQIFGWSEKRPIEEAFDPTSVRSEFDRIYDRLHAWRLRFLSEETSVSEADKLFAFPEEWKALQGPLETYLKVIFQPSRYARLPFLRGFYFTSGMQQGRPVAKACAAMLGEEGARSEVLESLEGVFQKQRAFFIRDFYREKLFREQGFIYRTPEALNRDKKLRLGAWIGGITLSVVSIALLALGVVRYNKALEPVRSTTAKVERLMQPGTEMDTSQALSAAGEISQRLAELHGTHASAAFFRTKENVVSRDLQDIHRALFEKHILAPVLTESGNRLATAPAGDAPEAQYYFPALKQYIRLLALQSADEKTRQKKLAELDITPLAAYYAASQGDAFDQNLFIKEYRAFVEEGGTLASLPAGDEGLASAIDALESYWPVSLELAPYRVLLDDMRGAERSFRELIRIAQSPGTGQYDAAKKSTTELLQFFKDAGTQVEAINKSGFLLTSPNALYPNLQAQINDGSPERKKLAARMQEQAKRVTTSISKTLGKPLGQYDFLVLLGPQAAGIDAPDLALDKKGSVKAKAKSAVKQSAGKLLEKAADQAKNGTRIAGLTPLTSQTLQAMERTLVFFEDVEKSDESLADTVNRVSGRPAGDQSSALRGHHDEILGRMEAALAEIRIEGGAGAPHNWKGEQIQKKMPAVLKAGYAKYLSLAAPYWMEVYGNYPLTVAPADISGWAQFKGLPLFLRGKGAYQIVDPVDELLNTFASKLPPEMDTLADGAKHFAAHIAWLKENRQRIADDAEAFVTCVWNLDDDPVKAWQQLHDSDAKAETTFANLDALSLLEEQAQQKFPEEKVLKSLADWSAKVRAVLTENVAARLSKDWDAMSSVFNQSLATSFPFGAEVVPEDLEGQMHRYSIRSASLSEMREFFAGTEGIGGILSRYRLPVYLDEEKGLPDIMSAPQKRFATVCHQWRGFLFQDDVERSIKLSVEYEPAGQEGASVGMRFTRLGIQAPGGFNLTFRPSSDKARSKEASWKLQTSTADASFSAKAFNEASGEEGSFFLEGGGLSLLAYTMKFGQPSGADRKKWLVKVELPDPQQAGAKLTTYLLVRFDQPVPEQPRL